MTGLLCGHSYHASDRRIKQGAYLARLPFCGVLDGAPLSKNENLFDDYSVQRSPHHLAG
jgi:hypothetical protein